MPIGHPVFWILVAAVVAPLLAEIPIGFRMPVVVLEVVLGIVLGPHVLNLVQFEGFVVVMRTIGMAMTLFMAGMELDFGDIKGRPLFLAIGGWMVSVVLGLAVVGILHIIPQVHAPEIVTLAICTTGLGVMVPILRDSSQLGTSFGRLFLAAGTLGELGPIIAMALLLSRRYSTWQESGFLLAFVAIVGVSIVVGVRARPPKVLAMLARHMRTSTQLPVRISLLMLGASLLLAESFGFEILLGALAAGTILGAATRGEQGEPLRVKMDAVCFGWFYPFFFVGTGVKFDIAALGRDLTTMLLVPSFLMLFLLVRGLPVFLYRGQISAAQRLPFALSSAVPSLSIIIVITEIGVKLGSMNSDVAAALVGAALVSVMLFPTIAGALLHRTAAQTQVGSQAI
jgi:Kef-type K+ transport system membrane component KefB